MINITTGFLMPDIKSEVFCTLQIEGTHNWPDCPFDEVDYLREKHRHVFHIKAHKVVTHDDRDTEFIMLKHDIEQYMWANYDGDGVDIHQNNSGIIEFGAMSCEMIARDLIDQFNLCRCEVNEDGENGAILYVD